MAKTRSTNKVGKTGPVTAPTTTPTIKKAKKNKKSTTKKVPKKKVGATQSDLSVAVDAQSTNNQSLTQSDKNIGTAQPVIDPQLLHEDHADRGDDLTNSDVPKLAESVPAPVPFMNIYRPVTFIANPTEIQDATFSEYDNQASDVEGRLMSTLHHHMMIVSGQKSHYARKMVQPRLDQHFKDTCNDMAIKIPTFNEADALIQGHRNSFFRDRIYNLLANALIVQYVRPQDATAYQNMVDNCQLEARSWTLELMESWDDRYRQEIKDNQGLRAEGQYHMQLASKSGDEE